MPLATLVTASTTAAQSRHDLAEGQLFVLQSEDLRLQIGDLGGEHVALGIGNSDAVAGTGHVELRLRHPIAQLTQRPG